MIFEFLACDFPPALGGIQKLTHGLARALVAAGHDVEVIATSQPHDDVFDATSAVPTVRCRDGSQLGTAFAMSRALRQALQNGRAPDAIVATKWSPEGHAYLLSRARRSHPMILMGHGREFLPERRRRLRAAAQRLVIRASAGAIVNSAFTGRQMLAAGMAERCIRIVHPAIDPAEFEPPQDLQSARRALNWPSGPTLLTVARLVRRKGVDTVIRSFPAIAQHIPEVHYVVVGEGPDEKRLRSMIRELGVESQVHFFGSVTDAEKAACLHLCNVFVLPSRDIPSEPPEGFGIVYLEANVCGKPVIAARTGGVEEAVEDGVSGMLVEPDNPLQLAEVAVELLSRPDIAQALGTQGRRRVIERFSWQVIAPQFVTAVESLI